MNRIAMFGGLFVLCLTSLSTVSQAQIIQPNPGEGKYRFCQRMYDGCMDGVVGSPGSQSYNVGAARCRAKWNTCRKTKTWTIGRAVEGTEFGALDSLEDDASFDSDESIVD